MSVMTPEEIVALKADVDSRIAELKAVDVSALTPMERSARHDDMARLGSLREMLRRDEQAAEIRARRAAAVGDPQWQHWKR